jgi:hypothetical protein
MPIGQPLQNFGPLTRKPMREVAVADKWSADRWGDAWMDQARWLPSRTESSTTTRLGPLGLRRGSR